jgi:hypothetical protein
MVAEEVFVNCYKFNPITSTYINLSKKMLVLKSKKIVFKVSYFMRSRSRHSDLESVESEPKLKEMFLLHNTGKSQSELSVRALMNYKPVLSV